MWQSSGISLPSVLIVENGSGDVFIIEDQKSEPQVDKILKTEKLKSKKRTKPITIETREPSPVPVR